MSKKIDYILDSSLIKDGVWACTSYDGRIFISPLVPEPYRDAFACHENKEWDIIIKEPSSPKLKSPSGKLSIDFTDPFILDFAEYAHDLAKQEELEFVKSQGIEEEYVPWRIKILNDEMKKAEEEGRLNVGLRDRFQDDIRFFTLYSKN